jgi:hypothetical protein
LVLFQLRHCLFERYMSIFGFRLLSHKDNRLMKTLMFEYRQHALLPLT